VPWEPRYVSVGPAYGGSVLQFAHPPLGPQIRCYPAPNAYAAKLPAGMYETIEPSGPLAARGGNGSQPDDDEIDEAAAYAAVEDEDRPLSEEDVIAALDGAGDGSCSRGS
jgi:hypothetical protein